MKNKMTLLAKKALTAVLATAIAFTSLVGATAETTKAATLGQISADELVTAQDTIDFYASPSWEYDGAAGTITKTFNVDVDSTVYVYFATPGTNTVSVTITNLVTGAVSPVVVGVNTYYTMNSGYAIYDGEAPVALAAGSYSMTATFTSAPIAYIAAVYRDVVYASLSATDVSVAVGLKTNVSVVNGTVASFVSSDTSVATVDADGTIKGKKAGSCTVTATTVDGQVLVCGVTVYKNQNSRTKPTVGNTTSYYNKVVTAPYSISYDKKGNLILKVAYVNKTPYKVNSVNNTKFTIKNADGKVVAKTTYSFKKKINSYSTKYVTIKIKKSKLKIKDKQDLTMCSVVPTGGKVK